MHLYKEVIKQAEIPW